MELVMNRPKNKAKRVLSDMPENNPVLRRRMDRSTCDIGRSMPQNPYPAVSSYILAINRKKQLNNELSVYHIGQRYISEGRAFGLYLTSTECNVKSFHPSSKKISRTVDSE